MKYHEQGGPIERLEAMTDADLQRWIDILMPKGTKCIYTVSLAVSRYHSRGVGSALLRLGTARTDKDGVFCWVHASEAGYRLFEEEGFKVVGTLDVDLDNYAPAPCSGTADGRWGHYVFRYMKRLSIKV
jgi:hypothetical protein